MTQTDRERRARSHRALLERSTSDLQRRLRADAARRGHAGRPAAEPDLRAALRRAPSPPCPSRRGEGFIPGFCECVAAILGHLGCEAWVTDAAGRARHPGGGRRRRPRPLPGRRSPLHRAQPPQRRAASTTTPRRPTATWPLLEAAAAGGLAGQAGAAARARPRGPGRGAPAASPSARACTSSSPTRSGCAPRSDAGLALAARARCDEGLAAADLVFDATPAAATSSTPTSVTAEHDRRRARHALGLHRRRRSRRSACRHIHEPLAVGVTVMAARALA